MSFWTGLEAFTGHQPGAFTGMTMKGLFDKDMWDRMPRTWSGQRTPTGPTDIRTGRAGEPMMTNWARGGGSGPTDSENQNIDRQRQALLQQFGAYPSMNATYPAMPAQAQTRAYVPTPRAQPIPVPGWTPPRNPAEVIQETGPYWGSGDAYSGWGGHIGSNKNAHMGMGASGYQVPQYTSGPRSNVHPDPMQQMLDMTTVKKITDDASPNTITQTVKQKVPANPTNTLMNMGKSFISGYQDLARKRLEEEMLQRQRGY